MFVKNHRELQEKFKGFTLVLSDIGDGTHTMAVSISDNTKNNSKRKQRRNSENISDKTTT